MNDENANESPPEETRIVLESWDDNLRAAVTVARAASYKLSILTRDLEPQVYSQDELLDELRRVAVSGRYASVRVLVQDSRRAVAEGHKLFELARRLTSFIEIRNPHPEHKHVNEAYLVADEVAVLYRKQADRYEGYADTDASLDARTRLREFDQMWERGVPDPEVRRLGI